METVVKTWLVVVKLLQDEDDDIREELSTFVSQQIVPHTTAKTTFKSSHAQKLVLAYLVAKFPDADSLWNYLVQVVCPESLPG